MFPKDKNGRLLGNNMLFCAQYISFPNYRARNMLELDKGAKFPLRSQEIFRVRKQIDARGGPQNEGRGSWKAIIGTCT